VTQGGLDNDYLSRAGHLGFFPADARGAANAKDGEGMPLIPHLMGLLETVGTDIAGSQPSFVAATWQRFFADHGIHAGDAAIR
jgi:hypothetical protein